MKKKWVGFRFLVLDSVLSFWRRWESKMEIVGRWIGGTEEEIGRWIGYREHAWAWWRCLTKCVILQQISWNLVILHLITSSKPLLPLWCYFFLFFWTIQKIFSFSLKVTFLLTKERIKWPYRNYLFTLILLANLVKDITKLF